MLDQVGLSEHAAKRVGALSGGMKQRLALGLALLADPPVLVLDEPTSNLDAAARDQFLHLLKAVKAAGKTVIFTSHRIEEIEALADQVLVMDRGKLKLGLSGRRAAAALGLRTTVKLRLAEASARCRLGACCRPVATPPTATAPAFSSTCPARRKGEADPSAERRGYCGDGF